MTKSNLADFFALARGWHQKFDRDRGGRPSFHNQFHLDAVKIGALKLVKAAKAGNDPMKIRHDLIRWNKDQHQEPAITLDEFEQVFCFLFAGFHDTGNIIDAVEVDEGGILKPKFNKDYSAVGAEKRSVKILKTILVSSNLPAKDRQRYFDLASHLIMESTFSVSHPNLPFAVLTRVVDQVGNDLLSSDPTRVTGLLNEIVGEDQTQKIVPFNFYNFSRVIFSTLVPNAATRTKILGIWQKQLPEVKAQYSKMPILAKDFLTKI